MEQKLSAVINWLASRFFRPIGEALLFPLLKHFAPNTLTMFRILGIAPIIWCLKRGFLLWALAIYILAALTDLIDGWLARKLGQDGNPLGKKLDPIADKLLIGSISIASAWKIGAWPVIATTISMVFLDLLLWLFRGWVKFSLKANIYGKYKMAFQSLAVGLLILSLKIPKLLPISISLMIVAILLAIASFKKHLELVKAA